MISPKTVLLNSSIECIKQYLYLVILGSMQLKMMFRVKCEASTFLLRLFIYNISVFFDTDSWTSNNFFEEFLML